ncbi:MAG: ABC transporter permease, partial [Acidimicrobiales bacterium]
MTALRWLVWNPIVAKELRSRMRSWRAPAVLVAYLVVLGVVGYAAYHTVASRSPGNVQAASQVGIAVFVVLSAAVLALMALLVPGLVGGVVSGERERQTLDLLLCTPVGPARIVVGKLASALAFVLVLLGASVPLFSAALLLGGISLTQIMVMLLVTLVTVASLGALALLCSVCLRRTTSSTIASYLLAAALFGLPVLVGTLGGVGAHYSVVGPPAAVYSGPGVPPQFRNGPPLVDLLSPATAAFTTLRADAGSQAFGAPVPGPS